MVKDVVTCHHAEAIITKPSPSLMSEIEMEHLLPPSSPSRRSSSNSSTGDDDENDENDDNNNNNNNNNKQLPSYKSNPTSPTTRAIRRSNSDKTTTVSRLPVIFLIIFVLVGLYLAVFSDVFPWSSSNATTSTLSGSSRRSPRPSSSKALKNIVPQKLVDAGIYNYETDFINPLGIRPTYWEPEGIGKTWGPCYPPPDPIEWNIINSTNQNGNKNDLEYSKYSLDHTSGKTTAQKQAAAKLGDCRPGFLIIGAGKCGTSSLYHYLVDGHPRILPAIEKQIHYFKYYLNKPLAWYYSWFPTTKSFLEHGALMTGEASPGYLPYPQVVKDIVRLMGERRSDGSVTLPKIIMLGREPIDRMYSSYRYNYVNPTLEAMSTGRVKGIQPNLPESEYRNHLFSLEDFVRSELKQLKRCLGTFGSNRPTEDTIGFGARKTFGTWYREPDAFRNFVNDRYVSRFDNDTSISANPSNMDGWRPPLVDLDEVCYGRQVNHTVFREQWAELQMNNPEKVILNKNLHLTQAMIGRGLYTFPLEWWYLLFRPEDIFFVCTEQLSDPKVLEDLTMHLGLPQFGNFSGVVSGGAYNVGGHQGYDQATSWDEIKSEEKQETSTNGSEGETITNGIPIPPDLYQELQEFINPINERLFSLTGKRCNWNK